MTRWSDVVHRGRARVLLRAWLAAAARAAALGAVLGILLIVLSRALNWGLPPWLLIAAPVAVGLFSAALVAFARRPGLLTIAAELDARLGLKDALGSAAALSAKPAPTGFEAQAIADGNTAAAGVDLRIAMPLPSARAWWPAALLTALAVGAVFIPTGWLAHVTRLITGHTPQTPAIAAQRKDAADSVAAVEKVLEAVKPAPVANEPPQTPGSEALLSDLQRDLINGKVTPEEGRQRTATILENAAEELNRRADAADAARAALRDRLAETQKQRPPGAPAPESDLSKALRDGDLEKAAQSAADLAKAMDQMPPSERKKLADELQELAKDLDAQPPQPKPSTTPNANKPADPAPLKDQPKPASEPQKQPDSPAPQAQPSEPSTESQGQEKAEADKRELTKNLQDTAKELEKPSQPPASDSSQTSSKDQNYPNGDSSQQPKPERGNPGEKPQPQPNGDSQPSPSDQPGTQPHPKPGEQPSDKPNEKAADKPGDKQGDKPGEKPNTQPGDQSQPQPGLPNPNGTPDRQAQGEKQNTTREQGEKGAPPPQPQPTPGSEKPNQPGAQPQPTDKPGDKPQPQPCDQPEGQQPTDLPDPNLTKEGLQRLKDQLDKLSQDQKDALRDRLNADKLRDQAQKMWDNASPDEKKQLLDLAKQLADQNTGQRKPQNQNQAQNQKPDQPQSGGENTNRPPNPDQPPLAGGGGEEKGNDHRGGAGDGPGHKSGAQPATGDMATRDVDARREPEGNAASARIIAEWLSQNPQKRAAGPANPAVSDAVRTAAQSAERAVDQRVVSNRLSPLVRKYFERLPGALGVPAPTSPAPPAPAPAPSPSGGSQ